MTRKKLSAKEMEAALVNLQGWKVDGGKLVKHYEFENFAESLSFVNKIGGIAEAADHHPDIKFGWGYADIELTTHDTGGLTHNDFDVAGKIERV